MRMLLVGAGAAFSTKDVEDGYDAALRGAGVDLVHYALGARLGLARRWLHMLWRARGRLPEHRPSWPEAIYRGSVEALEMALRHEVDWIFVVSGMFFHPDALELMRRAGLRTAVLFTESPYEDAEQARVAGLVDMCWTTERSSVERLRPANPNVRYVRHAYDPARHQPAEPRADLPEHDVVFVGTGFAERIEMLEQVDWSGIDLGLYGEWGLLPSRHKLRRYVRAKPISNESAVGLYRRARIGLNLSRSSHGYGRQVPRVRGAQSCGPRVYELAACEVFQLSERRPEVVETFGASVPTFTRASRLEQLVREHLARPQLRRRRARRARQCILPHTFAARAAQILADLEALDGRSLAKGA